MNIKEEMKKYKKTINDKLDSLIHSNDCRQKTIVESMRYSLIEGGKRLRPIIAIKSCELVGGKLEDILEFACAIEMIHTYSLIHDDLPCMDNDDYRRGKLTNHKVYGEAFALLAGDGLLNLAYETISNIMYNNLIEPKTYIEAFKELSSSCGYNGMIGGQVVDILSENKKIDKETLKFIHSKKTSALIEASLVCGGIIGKGSKEEIEKLRKFGKLIGLAFQIRDDVLDIIGDQDKLGKDIGSDKEKNKSTYVSIYGLEKSIEMTKELGLQAKECLSEFDNTNIEFFNNIVDYLICRDI